MNKTKTARNVQNIVWLWWKSKHIFPVHLEVAVPRSAYSSSQMGTPTASQLFFNTIAADKNTTRYIRTGEFIHKKKKNTKKSYLWWEAAMAQHVSDLLLFQLFCHFSCP